MISRHPSDDVSGDRKCSEQRAQRRQRGEQKACGAFGVLPDWEEPRHTGSTLLPIRYETIR
jgi:hypothetical protein